MTDDKITAALAPVRERMAACDDGFFTDQVACIRSAGDVPRLLAAVEAALSYHQRVPLYGNASTDGEPGNCPHDPDDGLHFEYVDEPGEWLCQGSPEGAVCASCTVDAAGERAPWPCDEYAALLGALTGRSAADVLAALTGKGGTDG